MKRIAVVLFPLLMCFGTFSLADTLTLVGTGSNQTNGVYTYPYYLSLNNQPGVAMMCLSFNNDITMGETWSVTALPIAGSLDKEAVWLFFDAQINPAHAIPDQLAAWALFANNVPMTAASESALASAIASLGTESAAFYEGFTVYTPTGDPNAPGYPQIFISDTLAPEPSTMFLLGTGLFLLLIITKRRDLLPLGVKAQKGIC
jgi:hypothetical protein